MKVRKIKGNEFPVHEKLSQSHALPARLYTDADVFQEEIDKIFSRNWQYVGHVSQLKNTGDFLTCSVANEQIVVTKEKDDVYHAFYNVCPHRGARLVQGTGNKKILQCPYHGWTFQLNGDLYRTPNFQGVENFDPKEYCLHSVKVEVAGPFIFVNLDPQAEPISNTLGPLFESIKNFGLESLKKVRTIEYRMKCNWKIIVDNFLECYHCPIAHPGFVDLIDMAKYKTHTFDNYSYQVGPPKEDADKARYGITDLENADMKDGRYHFVWPNMMFNLYPGGSNMSTNWIIPLDHENTLAVYEFFFKDENLNEEQEELIKLIDQVQREDIEICEYVQVGFKSRAYVQGRYALSENGVHHFHQLMQKAYRA